MIKISKAKETRSRDKKRNRFLLQIGNKSFHVTFKEIEYLADKLDIIIEREADKEISEDFSFGIK